MISLQLKHTQGTKGDIGNSEYQFLPAFVGSNDGWKEVKM